MAFLAVIAAWLSGARFVGAPSAGPLFGMPAAAGVALLAYVIILFVPARNGGS